MSAYDNPTAFPVAEQRNIYGEIILHGSYGMTLRDYFAGQALAGLFAQSNDAMIAATCQEALALGEKTAELTFAREAYEAADAMLAERAKAAK